MVRILTRKNSGKALSHAAVLNTASYCIKEMGEGSGF
jgi:hypothetical protein